MNDTKINLLIDALKVLNHEADYQDRVLVRHELLKELGIVK